VFVLAGVGCPSDAAPRAARPEWPAVTNRAEGGVDRIRHWRPLGTRSRSAEQLPHLPAGVGHGLLDTEGHCRGGAGGEFGALVAKRRLRVRRARAFERFAAFMNTLVVANTNVVKTRGKLFSGGALLP
jgi:hypothetical protein